MGGAGSGRKPGLYYDLARQYPRAYRSWQAMRQRCDPSDKDWKCSEVAELRFAIAGMTG